MSSNRDHATRKRRQVGGRLRQSQKSRPTSMAPELDPPKIPSFFSPGEGSPSLYEPFGRRT